MVLWFPPEYAQVGVDAWQKLLADAAAGRLQKSYRSQNHSALLHAPMPRRELLTRTARYYATINAVQTGRGCRHACRYCSVTAFHEATYRRRPVAEVVAELRTIPRAFIFVDDNIIADREYAAELFRAWRRSGNAGSASARS
jgi:radical SAM superfamily enzyme YgiQ (UPF0313 family)